MRLPHSVRDIVADLQQYALPLCDLFTDKAAAVAHLRQHGSALNPWLDNTKTCTAASFITPTASAAARRRTSSSATLSVPAATADAMPIFTPPTALASGQTDASNNSDFIGADELRFAYAQGIRFDF